jgi:hypothetical protein
MPCRGVIQRPKFSSFGIIFTSQVLNEYLKQNDNKVVSNNESTKKSSAKDMKSTKDLATRFFPLLFFLPFVWTLFFLRISFLRRSKIT